MQSQKEKNISGKQRIRQKFIEKLQNKINHITSKKSKLAVDQWKSSFSAATQQIIDDLHSKSTNKHGANHNTILTQLNYTSSPFSSHSKVKNANKIREELVELANHEVENQQEKYGFDGNDGVNTPYPPALKEIYDNNAISLSEEMEIFGYARQHATGILPTSILCLMCCFYTSPKAVTQGDGLMHNKDNLEAGTNEDFTPSQYFSYNMS